MNGDKQHAVWRESIEKYGKTIRQLARMKADGPFMKSEDTK